MRFDRIAAAGYDVAIPIQLKITRACIGDITCRAADLEKALALNHQIQWIVGLLKISLREDNRIGGGPGAQTQLKAARHHGLRPGRGAWLQEALVKQVLKLGPARLESDRVGIGQIIGDVIDAHLLSSHAAGGAI